MTLEAIAGYGFRMLTVGRAPAARRTLSGFTILELLTSICICAVLLSLLLPAISAARESARRAQCSNNLRQIGSAIHQYHDTNFSMPVGWQFEATRQSAYGWAESLLPQLEQLTLYSHINRNVRLQEPRNDLGRHALVSTFICPSDIAAERFTLYGVSPTSSAEMATVLVPLVDLPTANYQGVFGTLEADDSIPAPLGDGSFLESRAVRFSELRRGLSNTMIVGERTMARVPSTWLGVDMRGEDAACRLVGTNATAPNCGACDECEFDSRHAGGAYFLFADGHVRMISDLIDRAEYRQLGLRY